MQEGSCVISIGCLCGEDTSREALMRALGGIQVGEAVNVLERHGPRTRVFAATVDSISVESSHPLQLCGVYELNWTHELGVVCATQPYQGEPSGSAHQPLGQYISGGANARISVHASSVAPLIEALLREQWLHRQVHGKLAQAERDLSQVAAPDVLRVLARSIKVEDVPLLADLIRRERDAHNVDG